MPEFRSINDAVSAASHRSGVPLTTIWSSVRAKYGAVRGLSADKRGEVEAYLEDAFRRPETAAEAEAGSPVCDEMTVSEAQSRLCWRGVTPSGKCEPSRCMAWRIVSVFDRDGCGVELTKRGLPGYVSLGRCKALPGS